VRGFAPYPHFARHFAFVSAFRGAQRARVPITQRVPGAGEREGPGTHTQRVPGAASHISICGKLQEREGRSHLAEQMRFSYGERKGRSPLASHNRKRLTDLGAAPEPAPQRAKKEAKCLDPQQRAQPEV
jgi:hypothetical protein